MKRGSIQSSEGADVPDTLPVDQARVADKLGCTQGALRLFVTCVSLLVALAVIEIVLRLFFSPPPRRIFQPNDDYGWMHIPGRSSNHDQINRNGLYDLERQYAHPPGTYRILLLGDSFIEGIQVPIEDTIGRQLEDQLNAHGNQTYEVINGGSSGFGTANEVLFYRSEGYKYSPDLVILGFLFNDLYDNLEMPYFYLQDGDLQEKTPTPKNVLGPLGELRGWLYDHTYSYGYAATSWKIATGLIKYGAQGTGVRSPAYLRDIPPKLQEAWALTDELVGLLNRQVTDDGALLIVLGIAAPASMFPEKAPREYDVELVNRRLGEMLQEHNIPYLDLLPIFREHCQGNCAKLYLSDGHWSPHGHNLAAQAVLEIIVD